MTNVTTINLRNLPEELVKKAKVEAIRRGMSLKGFVIEAISVGCGEPVGQGVRVGKKPRAAKSEIRPETSEPTTAPSSGMTEQPVIAGNYSRPAHDPKECRLHGCLMCKMARE